MKAVHVITGTRRAAEALRRRHRPDHPRRVAEAGRAHRVREGPVRHVARRPQLRAQRRALRRRRDPRRRPGVRRRLVARARRLGDPAVRVRRRDRAELLRHLPQQLHQERARARSCVPEPVVERIWAAIEADPTTEIVVDVERLVVEVPAIGLDEPFPMDPPTQHRFLHGLDDVGITLTHADEIDAYEATRAAWLATT